jgi:integrative and conjugative element protein (TIGR02256 family)
MDTFFALNRAAMYEPFKLIWLPRDTLHVLRDDARAYAPRETGGVLIGYRAAAGTELVVTDIVGPGPMAKHTTRTFFPDLDYQHDEISRHHKDSGGVHTYIGDWHSHPAGGALLSRKDKRVLRRVAFSSAARTPNPVMLILGGSKNEWFAASWQITHRSILRCTFGPLAIASFDA